MPTEQSSEISDDELGALVLAADPGAVVDPDAISPWSVAGIETDGPLPSW